MRVITPDVGGGFGSRSHLHPEPLVLAWAAKRLGRTVRWTSDRSEAFVTDFQGRDIIERASLALDFNGRLLALRVLMTGNLGAYTASYAPLQNAYRIATNVYDIPLAFVQVRAALTNTTPTVPFRGRPARSDARRRTADRPRRRPTGHRPPRASPAQPRAHRATAVPHGGRVDV